jgi:glutathione S-transferase
MPAITLYFSPFSRSFTARWMLEEIGAPYAVKTINLRKNEQNSPEFLQLNPMGKVPALTDGAVTVSENPAICIYLADRYSLGDLAPQLDDPRRGSYLRWMIFSTAVFEPAIYLPHDDDPTAASGRGWGKRGDVINALDGALSEGPWLLGDRFTAADVMMGSLLSVALFSKRIAEPPNSLASYDQRVAARPAYRRAAEATWPATKS